MQAAAFLRRKTETLHQETENLARGQQILDRDLSLSQYRYLISNNFYLHKHLEPLLSDALTQNHLTAFLPFLHPRLEGLRQDLTLLRLSEPEFGPSPPAFANPWQVLGGLYVLLGSGLGGKVIYAALRETSHLQDVPEFHFYASAGRHPAKEWPQFCRLLDQYLSDERKLKEAGNGAVAVFRFFHSVYAGSQQAS